MTNPYIGCESQLRGFEAHRLLGGKGDGMRLLQIRNGLGMELTVSLDRCCDIARLSLDGVNMSYFSPCGYVAPAFYQPTRSDWLKSFTAGFLTTCGLNAVGSPCEDAGEMLPLHGTIANTPADETAWYAEGGDFVVRAVVHDEQMFGRKLQLHREIRVSTTENKFCIRDTIQNTGDRQEPLELLYHMNMGYPLLDEDSLVDIPSARVTPRDAHAAQDIENWMHMEPPQAGYQERCYYHTFADANGMASIFQPKLNKGLKITFDAAQLDGFVEWKMMGYRDYVLGLECGNCYPDGRDAMRKSGMLKFLLPGESVQYHVNIAFFTVQ